MAYGRTQAEAQGGIHDEESRKEGKGQEHFDPEVGGRGAEQVGGEGAGMIIFIINNHNHYNETILITLQHRPRKPD